MVEAGVPLLGLEHSNINVTAIKNGNVLDAPFCLHPVDIFLL
jgi:hypothetical protein